MFEAQNLTCIRDERVLFSSLSFCVDPGEIVQIAGRNGAGKTSLLRILIGLTSPAEGQVCWQKMPVNRDRENFHRKLLWCGHQPGVKSTLSAEENLQFYHPDSDRAARWQALEACGLVGYEDVAVGQMSAGQQRRVALARLWLTKAPLWLLDEPFTALDPHGIERLTTRFEQHAAAGGMVVLTTHQPLRPLAVPLRQIFLGEGNMPQ
ncbi:cytochrome c biogenesis ATP-binding export protein CcmA [Salmonella enterica subsp. enterica serovar Choleraesuis]|nr:cytochrome c biogenesis ATP-binding export protein CcmA [Salmonella enterica subsp. enterica serovar Choleraesuis]